MPASRTDGSPIVGGGQTPGPPATAGDRHAGARLPRIAACFALGIAASLAMDPQPAPGVPALAAMAAGALGLTLRGAAWKAAMAIAVACLGMAWASLRAPVRPPEPWRGLATLQRPLVEARGVIATTPTTRPTQRGSLADHALVSATPLRAQMLVTGVRTSAGWHETRHRVWLRIDEPPPGLAIGQALSVIGRFDPVRGPGNPGEPDLRPHAAQRGIVGAIASPGGELVRSLGPAGSGWSAMAFWNEMRARAARSLGIAPAGATDAGETADAGETGDAGDPHAAGRSLLAALVLGQREHDDHESTESYSALGIAHLLAVSGLHLALLVSMALLVARLLGDRPGVATGVVLAVLLVYTLLVPAKPPILRAAIMAGAFTLGGLARRRYPPMNLLGLAAIIVLIIWPADLLSAGFQLSFLVVAALIIGSGPASQFVRRWRDPLGLRPPMPMPIRWCVDGLATAMVAWIASLPIVWAHFGVISWLSVPATLLATPIAALLLGWGFVAVLVGAVWPAVGRALAEPAAALATQMDRAAHAVADWPAIASHAPMLPAPAASIATAAIFAALLLLPAGVGVHVPARAWRGPVLAALAGALAILLGSWHAHRLAGDMVVRWDALQVGDGACHIVRTREHAIMFDAGSMWFGVGQREIPRAAKAIGAVPIHTAIVSHPDVDHFSGLPDAAAALGLRRVLVTNQLVRQAGADAEGPAAALLDELSRRSIEVVPIAAGDRLTLAPGVSAVVLHPPPDLEPSIDNEASAVLLIEAATAGGPRRMLLTADLQTAGIPPVRDALRRLGDPAIHAMDAPHHGSAKADAIALVRGLGPSLVVQSTGPQRLDDPRWEPVRAETMWISTAADGAATVSIHRDGSVRVRRHGTR